MNTNAAPLRDTANNLAQYGRYGDSMLVHMNPVEVEGIASLSPTGRLTINPVTGQPEAFLPFLAPILGSLAGSTLLTGTTLGGILGSGLSSAAAGAIGAGLGSWAESGDIREGLISGLTGFGVGKALGALGGAAKTAEGVSESISGAADMTMIDPSKIGVSPDVLTQDYSKALYPTTLSEAVSGAGEAGMSLGDRASFLAANKGEIIPNLMQQAPLIATGEMGRSQLQATKELEDSLGNIGEDDEENLQRQYDILGGAWDQLARDYNYPVQPYPRYSNNGGLVKRYQEGGLLTGGPEQAAARQAAIRGSVFVPPPETNAAGQPWRAGFDAEHNYFGNPPKDRIGLPVLPLSDETAGIPEVARQTTPQFTGMYSPTYDPSGNYGGQTYDSPQPQRRDYGDEEGMDFRRDYQDWLGAKKYAGQVAPDSEGEPSPSREDRMEARTERENALAMTPSPVMQPPPVMSPPPEETYSILPMPQQVGGRPTEPPPPPVMQPPAPMPPPVMQPPPVQPFVPPPPPPMQSMPQPIPVPTRQPVAPPPLPELGPRPSRRDYDDEGGAMEYRSDLREWNALKKEIEGSQQGFQEGGIVDLAANDQAMMAEQPVDPAMQQEAQMADELIQQTVMAILGRVDDPDVIIDMFIDQFGQEAYLALREQVLNTVVPGAQTEGMIEGQGDGMSDEVMGMIGDQQQVATSPGEYIVPADVVSGIGNGSSDSGAQQLDGMINSVRQERTGTVEQPEAIIPEEMMP